MIIPIIASKLHYWHQHLRFYTNYSISYMSLLYIEYYANMHPYNIEHFLYIKSFLYIGYRPVHCFTILTKHYEQGTRVVRYLHKYICVSIFLGN